VKQNIFIQTQEGFFIKGILMKLKYLSGCVLALFVSQGWAAQNYVLDDVRLIDGNGGPVQEHMRIVTDGSNIATVGPASSVQAPAGAEVKKYSGMTVIPGLISDHVHLAQYEGVTPSPDAYTRENILRQLNLYQKFGVTTVMSLGVNRPLFYEIRAEQHQGNAGGADVFGADHGIGVPQGGPPVQAGPDQLDRPATPEEAREAVRAAASRKADAIKLWLDDFQGQKLVKMKPEIYRAVIEEAHQQGLKVFAHIYYLQDAKDLIKAGVDILGHGVRDKPVDEEFLDLMKKHGTVYIPTLGVDESFYLFAEQPDLLDTKAVRESLNPEQQTLFSSHEWARKQLASPAYKTWKAGFETNLQNTLTVYKNGLRTGFGTDSGANPMRIPGFAEHHELALLVKSGLTPPEAISLATRSAAETLGLQDRGVIAAGKKADLVIIDGQPDKNISDISKISEVWHNGKETTEAPGR